MRLELTRPNGHYPLKVARLPIPPSLHICSVSQNSFGLCPEQDSNLHVSQHSNLKRARLPFRHLGLHRLVGCRHKFKLAWAENETRTRDPNLGKVMLYQLSYFRIFLICCSVFQGAIGLFPFCECKGTAFFWTTKQFLKKSEKKVYFSSKNSENARLI